MGYLVSKLIEGVPTAIEQSPNISFEMLEIVAKSISIFEDWRRFGSKFLYSGPRQTAAQMRHSQTSFPKAGEISEASLPRLKCPSSRRGLPGGRAQRRPPRRSRTTRSPAGQCPRILCGWTGVAVTQTSRLTDTLRFLVVFPSQGKLLMGRCSAAIAGVAFCVCGGALLKGTATRFRATEIVGSAFENHQRRTAARVCRLQARSELRATWLTGKQRALVLLACISPHDLSRELAYSGACGATQKHLF